jgi:hypothetical protein
MSGDTEGAEASSYQSKYAPDTVFQPNVQSSDPNYSDEAAAVATYQRAYGTTGKASSGGSNSGNPAAVPYPKLKMAYTQAPVLEPFPASSAAQGSGSATAPDLDHPVVIDLASLLTAENAFLTATKALVDTYENTFMPEIKAAMASTTLFGQTVTVTGVNTDTEAQVGNNALYQPTNQNSDPLDQTGVEFAAAINPQMSKMLQSIGNVIEVLGLFTANINQAGQLYASADKNSAFPDPGDMIGPIVHKS